MDYDFASLSPADFEKLACDLVGREFGLRFERFSPGPDGGMDGRYVMADGAIILQAKHYRNSGFAKLKAAMKRERKAIDLLAPRRYVLATSVRLSPQNKDTLVKIIGGVNTGDIFGPADLNGLLQQHPEVEKANPNLWVPNTPILESIVTKATSEAIAGPIGDATQVIGRVEERLVAVLELLENRVAVDESVPLKTIRDILERDGFVADTPAAAIGAVSRIVSEIKHLRESASEAHAIGDPSLMAAAAASLELGDLDGYAEALSKALTQKQTEQNALISHQFNLIEQLAETYSVQGKFDDAIVLLENGISLFASRTDKPTEPFTGRWKIALIVAEKGWRLRDPSVMRNAISMFDDLESNMYVEVLTFLRGRIIVNRFRIKKLLLIMDFRFDEIPQIVPELQLAMELAQQGTQEDIRQTRIAIWDEIFDAANHVDDIDLLLRSLDIAKLMHADEGYEIPRKRKTRSDDDIQSFGRFLDASSRLLVNLCALYRVDQNKFAHHKTQSLELSEQLLSSVRKFGLAKVPIDVVVLFSISLAECARICQYRLFAREACILLCNYVPEKRDRRYLSGLPELEMAKAQISLQHWWELSTQRNTGEIAILEAEYRAVFPSVEQYRQAVVLEYCGDAYLQAALIRNNGSEHDAFSCYARALILLEPILRASPIYCGRLRARVWNKMMTLPPDTYLRESSAEAA